MYQIAFGGYKLAGTDYFSNSPNIYYEPGYTILFPLEFTLNKCDVAYFLIRQRANPAGTSFNTVAANTFNVTVRDSTTGENVDFSMTDNTINSGWNAVTPTYNPCVLSVAIKPDENEILRVRNLEIQIVNTVDNNVITFRVAITDENLSFSYLTVYNGNDINDLAVSTLANNAIITLSYEGSYTILSPSASFEETSEVDDAAFSFPQDSVYYKRTNLYNMEEYDFSIEEPTHGAIRNNVRLVKIPERPHWVILQIDGYARQAFANETGNLNFKVVARSRESGETEGTFVVYLQRKPFPYMLDG